MVRDHLRRVKIISPEINHLLSSAQTDSARPDNNHRLPPLYTTTDRDQHSPSLNRPNDDSSTKRYIANSVYFPALGPPSEDHKGKARASGHNMGSYWRIQYIPCDKCPFEWCKEVKYRLNSFNTRYDSILYYTGFDVYIEEVCRTRILHCILVQYSNVLNNIFFQFYHFLWVRKICEHTEIVWMLKSKITPRYPILKKMENPKRQV